MTSYIDADDAVLTRTNAIKLHGPEGFEGMRKAGRLAAEILDMIAPHMAPGVETQAIDDMIREAMLRGGAVPATLGYRGYTHSSCISINHVVCHGIPSDRVLKDGDIVNVDVTPLLDGWHGDTSRMFLVGDVGVKAKRLVDVTYEAMMLGIEQAKPGWATSRMQSRASPRSIAMASSAISAVMGWGGCSTMRPRSSMRDAPAPGRS